MFTPFANFGVFLQVAKRLLKGLRFVERLEFHTDVRYSEFLLRVKHVEQQAKASGIWDAPHPWLNLFVSKASIHDFDRMVFKGILKGGIGGPMLVYPLLRRRYAFLWPPIYELM